MVFMIILTSLSLVEQTDDLILMFVFCTIVYRYLERNPHRLISILALK